MQQIQKKEENLAAKLTTSKQFASMKLLMQKKSQEVVKLKRLLAQYEPQDIANADSEDTRIPVPDSEFDY